MLGIAGQWPGNNGIYHGYFHPVRTVWTARLTSRPGESGSAI